MSVETLQLLKAYDALPVQEQQAFVRELVDRHASTDTQKRGLNEAQAADLRARLKTFVEDWERPEMSVYDEAPTR